MMYPVTRSIRRQLGESNVNRAYLSPTKALTSIGFAGGIFALLVGGLDTMSSIIAKAILPGALNTSPVSSTGVIVEFVPVAENVASSR